MKVFKVLFVFGMLTVAVTNVRGAEIFGSVSDEGGLPLAEVFVSAYASDGSVWQVVDSAVTNAAGAYFLEGLPNDTYRILLRDTTGVHVDEWYQDANQIDSAQDVVVDAGQPLVRVDVQLALAGWISGEVTDASTNSLAGMRVSAYRSTAGGDWIEQSAVFSDVDGSYRIAGLSPGTYRLGVQDPGGQFLSEFYLDAASVAQAQDLSIVVGVPVTGIQVELDRGGTISGQVTNEQDSALAGILVIAYSDVTQVWMLAAVTQSDIAGHYLFENLPHGNYRISLHDHSGLYQDEWYSDAAVLDDAQVIPVSAGSSSTGVDVELARADRDGDGWADDIDNCPDDSNPNQDNFDLDDSGDVCDPDDDNDGIPDTFELNSAVLDPLNPADAAVDADDDGLSNLLEFEIGTTPDNPDTDGDGRSDGIEYQSGTNPTINEPAVLNIIHTILFYD